MATRRLFNLSIRTCFKENAESKQGVGLIPEILQAAFITPPVFVHLYKQL